MDVLIDWVIEVIVKEFWIDLCFVERVLELFESGNIILFIVCYCKDELGGFDEKEICVVKDFVS